MAFVRWLIKDSYSIKFDSDLFTELLCRIWGEAGKDFGGKVCCFLQDLSGAGQDLQDLGGGLARNFKF